MAEYDKCECAACSLLVPKSEAMKIRTRSYATGRTPYDVWLCSSCYAQYLAERARRARRDKRHVMTVTALVAVLLIYMSKGLFLTPKDDRTRIEVATAATDTIPEIVARTVPPPPPKQSTDRFVSPVGPQPAADSPPSSDDIVRPVAPQPAADSPPSSDDIVRPVAPRPTATSLPKESTDPLKRTASSPPKRSIDPPKRTADAPIQPTFEGPGVTRIQNRLIELGYLKGASNGRWGPTSWAALREFKVANGLPADDKWDQATSEHLFSTGLVSAPPSMAPGARAQ